jgi:hypothetical protein
LVVLRATEKKDLMRSNSYINWPGLVAPVLGPPVGGFITTYASWRWIFFLNVPLGLLGMALTAVLIANERGAGVHPFDWTGFLLSGVSCTTLMYSLELVGQQATHWSSMFLYLAVSIVTGALAVWHFRRHPTPLLDFSSLQLRTFAVTIWGGSLFRIAISVIPFLLPLMFQVGFGMDAFTSGLLVLAVFAGNLGMKTVTTPVIRRFGFRNVLLVNGILTAAVLFIGGLCRSLQFTALNTLGFADIPPSQMSPTTTFYSMVQQMTMGMGVAAGAIALRLAMLLRGGSPGTVTITDFHVAFGLVTLLAIASVMDFFTLEADAGAVVSGHKRALRSD